MKFNDIDEFKKWVEDNVKSLDNFAKKSYLKNRKAPPMVNFTDGAHNDLLLGKFRQQYHPDGLISKPQSGQIYIYTSRDMEPTHLNVYYIVHTGSTPAVPHSSYPISFYYTQLYNRIIQYSEHSSGRWPTTFQYPYWFLYDGYFQNIFMNWITENPLEVKE